MVRNKAAAEDTQRNCVGQSLARGHRGKARSAVVQLTARMLVAVSASFVQFARPARLIQGELVAIDGSRIRAVASKKALAPKVDLRRTQQAISEEIAGYLSHLDSAD